MQFVYVLRVFLKPRLLIQNAVIVHVPRSVAWIFFTCNFFILPLQSNQVRLTPLQYINEMII